jgi:Uma2 family endonuclease
MPRRHGTLSGMTPCDTLPMSTVKLDLDEPSFWTEQAYLSLGETRTRIELIDGGLWVSPSSSMPHNEITRILVNRLWDAARTADLRAVQVPNLRLAPDRILIPDIAVGHFPRNAVIGSASDAVLVVEVTSPGNATVDRTLKKELYAQAKIDWYLLVEPDFDSYESVSLHLLRRQGGEYFVHALAKHGEALVSELPFPLQNDTTALLDF